MLVVRRKEPVMKRFTSRACVLGALLATASSATWALDINEASTVQLQAAGFSAGEAQRIVLHRQQHGIFASTQQVLKVKGMTTSALERASTKGQLTVNGAPLAVRHSAKPAVRTDLDARLKAKTEAAERQDANATEQSI